MAEKKHNVFISYSSDDRMAVDELVRKLKARGIDVWDDKSIRGGKQWPDKVRKAIQESDTVLVIVSPHFVESPIAQVETGIALGLIEESPETRIIPILLSGIKEASLPPLLRHKKALHAGRMSADKLSAKIQDVLNASA